MICLALVAGFDCFSLVLDGVPVAHQACISKAHVVTDLTFQFVSFVVSIVRGTSLLVLLLGDRVMGQGLLVLAQVVVALTAAHVVHRQTTFTLDTCKLLVLFVLATRFIKDGRTEIIQSSLVVVHHHVALASFVVSLREFYRVHLC